MTEDPTPQHQPYAVDVTTDGGVMTARIVGPVVEQHRGGAILQVVGEASEAAGDSLRCLVLDLGNVTFINSSGLGACVQLQHTLDEKGVRMIAYRPADEVLDLLRRMKLDKLFTIARTPAELAGAVG